MKDAAVGRRPACSQLRKLGVRLGSRASLSDFALFRRFLLLKCFCTFLAERAQLLPKPLLSCTFLLLIFLVLFVLLPVVAVNQICQLRAV